MPAGPDWPGIINHSELLQLLHEVASRHGMKVGQEYQLGLQAQAPARCAPWLGKRSRTLLDKLSEAQNFGQGLMQRL